MSLKGYVVCVGEKKCAFRILAEKPEGKRPLEKRRYRREGHENASLKK